MSRLVSIINQVREQCDENWLTDSQLQVYDSLRTGYSHHRLLNVYGEPGTGKTVLAWVLERSGYARYVHAQGVLPRSVDRLIVDAFPAYRRSARRLVDTMDELEIGHVVIVTDKRVDDDYPALEVVLTPDDIVRCKANLYQHLGIEFIDESPCANLHHLLSSITR